MIRTLLCAAVATAALMTTTGNEAEAQNAYGRQFSGSYTDTDWNRFYHYPYVYYPQNYWGSEYYRSADSLYHRYPAEMRIPVYNKRWHNYYPSPRKFHSGHHFILDVF